MRVEALKALISRLITPKPKLEIEEKSSFDLGWIR